MRTQQEGTSNEQERGSSPGCNHAGPLDLGLPAARTLRSKFISVVVRAAQTD